MRARGDNMRLGPPPASLGLWRQLCNLRGFAGRISSTRFPRDRCSGFVFLRARKRPEVLVISFSGRLGRERPAKPLTPRRDLAVIRGRIVADPGCGHLGHAVGDPVPAPAFAVVGPPRDCPADLHRTGGEDRVVMLVARPAPGTVHSIHRQGRSNLLPLPGVWSNDAVISICRYLGVTPGIGQRSSKA